MCDFGENRTFAHSILYIYIYSSVFRTFPVFSTIFTKLRGETERKQANSLWYYIKYIEHTAKRVIIKYLCAFYSQNKVISFVLLDFASFYCIIKQIHIHRNDNGKFTRHFDAKQPTQKRKGVCKTYFSHNIPRHHIMT